MAFTKKPGAFFRVIFVASVVILSLAYIFLSFPGLGASEDGDEPRLVIRNNELSNSGFGVYVGPRDEKVLIQGNTLTGHAEAIRLTGVKDENVVRNNRIANNLAGITIRDFYSDNEEGYVNYPVDPEDIKISNNEFVKNEEGNIIKLLEENGFTGEGSDQENQEGETTADDSSGEGEPEEETEGTADTEKKGKESTTGTSTELQETGESSSETDTSTTGNTEDTSMEEDKAGGQNQDKAIEKTEESSESGTTAEKENKVAGDNSAESSSSSGDNQTEETSEDPTMEDEVEETSEEAETTEETSETTGETEGNTTETGEATEGVEDSQEERAPKEENGYTPNSGNPYLIAGATVVGLTTLLLVLKNSM